MITSSNANDNTNIKNTLDNNIIKFKKDIDYHSNLIITRKVSGKFIQNSKGSQKNSIENRFIMIPENEIESNIINEKNDNLSNQKNEQPINEFKCKICLEDKLILKDENSSINSDNFLVEVICGHQFCFSCWRQYLTMKIEEGNVVDIICPSSDCFAIISPEIVRKLVSKETVEKYLHFDLKAFVDSNHSFKWCPYPNCGFVVRKPRPVSDGLVIDLIQHDQKSLEYSRSVDCGNGHYFCWDCLQEGIINMYDYCIPSSIYIIFDKILRSRACILRKLERLVPKNTRNQT
jgi:hypothetical protein